MGGRETTSGKVENKFRRKFGGQNFDLIRINRETYPPQIKRAFHPFHIRLKDTATYTVDSPQCLKGAGFASVALGLFTLFRPGPLLLYSILCQIDKTHQKRKIIFWVFLFFWHGIVLFVLLFLGMLLTISMTIKKRSVLMIHPWGLLLLYFDVVVWVLMSFILQMSIHREPWHSKAMPSPHVVFYIIYVENGIFCLLFYTYATYFVAAELTVIERFFQ